MKRNLVRTTSIVILSIFVLVMILGAVFSAKATEPEVTPASDVKIFINNVEFVPDIPPIIVNDRTMLPFRTLFEKLNAKVDWDGETRTVFAQIPPHMVVLQIDNPKAFVDNTEFNLDAPPIIYDDRTYVPVRFVAQAIGAEVTWDETTRSVHITL